jgi:hypothetical protein
MGFSALDGVPMGTRPGLLDPGVLLFLMREDGLGVEALEKLLYKQSGLLGLSGVSNDLRELHTSDDPRAAEAIDYFVYRVGQTLGSLCASIGGLDAWSSPPASARTTPTSASASAPTRPGSVSRSTRRPTPAAARASARRVSAVGLGHPHR